jgi:hypothetical protein
MKKQKTSLQFVLCIRNDGCDDLEPRKVYQALADPRAAEEGYIRIIDESGEDYLYREDYFVPIDVPTDAAKMLRGASRIALRGRPVVQVRFSGRGGRAR